VRSDWPHVGCGARQSHAAECRLMPSILTKTAGAVSLSPAVFVDHTVAVGVSPATAVGAPTWLSRGTDADSSSIDAVGLTISPTDALTAHDLLDHKVLIRVAIAVVVDSITGRITSCWHARCAEVDLSAATTGGLTHSATGAASAKHPPTNEVFIERPITIRVLAVTLIRTSLWHTRGADAHGVSTLASGLSVSLADALATSDRL